MVSLRLPNFKRMDIVGSHGGNGAQLELLALFLVLIAFNIILPSRCDWDPQGRDMNWCA